MIIRVRILEKSGKKSNISLFLGFSGGLFAKKEYLCYASDIITIFYVTLR